jgi:hypothetical protein
MPSYVVRDLRPEEGQDLGVFANDVKAAFREAGKEQNISIKKIKVVDGSVQFNVDSTALAEKVIEVVKRDLGLVVELALSPLSNLAAKYGLNKLTAKQ